MRTPSQRRRAWRDWYPPIRYWIVVAAIVVWVLVLLAWRERPPRPKPATIAATEFSADRAWPVLSYLADTIRYRVAGTPGADSAVAYLTRILRSVPGVEVEVQAVSGAWEFPHRSFVLAYTVRNVLVRIPGRSPEAVLFSAHYDTPPGSVGAADDGVAVAALVEIVRALAAGPRPAHTVIVNINDGEEQGLVGAHGFTQHPWIKDVKAFVNLESAGPHGKAILFQTGPGNAWLARAYARAVPYPYGTVLAQDIFQSGAVPSDTDFRIYRDIAHLVGLDIALYRGGWAYHTQRDRTWNVTRGTVQHMGENALALARTLANGPLPGNVSAERAVYYDLLGLTMVSYSAHTAVVLAGIAILLGLAALAVARGRQRLRLGDVGLAVVFAIVSVIVALLGALSVAVIAAYIVERPMSWFAHPGAGILAFALAALAEILAFQRTLAALFARRGVGVAERALAIQGAVLIVWMGVLAAATAAGVGSAYLALWWTVWGAVGLWYTALARDARWWIGALLGAFAPGVLTLQLIVLLTGLFVPVFGRLPLPIAPDLVLAAIVAVPTAAIALALLAGAHRAGGLGAVAIATGVVAVGALVVGLTLPRYTFRHPQRLVLVHEETDAERVLRVLGVDYDTPKLALAHASGFHPARGGGERALEYDRPAGATGLEPPRLELVATRADSAHGTRTLDFRATATGAFRLRVWVPWTRIAAWSISATLPEAPGRGAAAGGTGGDRSDGSDGAELRVDYIAPPDTGWRFSLDVRGTAPLPVRLEAVRLQPTHDAAAVLRTLPTWTDAHVLTVNGARWTF